ncbi:MAG: hypothetical protein FWC27_07460 [Firmicutes bacterium]|nr:hypothetical protein [Bacillota bacterium]
MDNPNNGWVYYPPPGYTPPPPPQNGLMSPPAGKSSALALAMVCVMALGALVAALSPFLTGPGLIDSLLEDPVYLALSVACLLCNLLVYLKFALPGWEPHRKTLSWLLGAAILAGLAFSVYAAVQGFSIGLASAGEILGDDPVVSGIMRGSLLVGGVIGGVVGIAVNPFFWLLIGAGRKKSMEKVAGLVSIISLGFSLLSVLITTLVGSLAAGGIELPDNLWTGTLPSLVSGVCAIIFYFTWPVLERPVLEK